MFNSLSQTVSRTVTGYAPIGQTDIARILFVIWLVLRAGKMNQVLRSDILPARDYPPLLSLDLTLGY